jgi:hypothetical protein
MTPADLADAVAHLRRSNAKGCHRLADALAAVAEGRAGSLDKLLLDRGPGRRAITTLARLERRNAAIVAAAARYDGTPEERGRALHSDVVNYSLSGYGVHRRTGRPAANRLHLFRILAECVDSGFPGPSMLGKIIRAAE